MQVRVGRPPGSARPLVALSPAVEARAGPHGWEVSLFEAFPAAAAAAAAASSSSSSSSSALRSALPGTGEDSGELVSAGAGGGEGGDDASLAIAISRNAPPHVVCTASFATAHQQQHQGPKAFARVEDMWSGGGKGAEGDFAAASALRTPRASVDGLGGPGQWGEEGAAAAASLLLSSGNGNYSGNGRAAGDGENGEKRKASDGTGHTFLMNAPSLAALAFRVDVTDRETGALLARGFAPADALKELEGELVVPLLSPCLPSPSATPPPPSSTSSAFDGGGGGGGVISPEPAGEFRASFLVITALPHPSNSLAGLQRAKWNASVDSAASSSSSSSSASNIKSSSSVAEKGRTLDIGHRGVGATAGARARVAENTLLSLQAAAAVHSDFVEFDVHVTADGEVVVHHDFAVVLALGGSGKPQGALSAAAAAPGPMHANGNCNGTNGGGVVDGASPPRTLPGPAPTDAAVRLGIPCLTLAQLRSSAIAAAMRTAAQHAAVSGKGKKKHDDNGNSDAPGTAAAVASSSSCFSAATATANGSISGGAAPTTPSPPPAVLEGHGQNQHHHDDEAATTAAALVSHAAALGRTLKRTLSSGEDILRTHAPPPMISSPERHPVAPADVADAVAAAAEVFAVVGSPLQEVPEETGSGLPVPPPSGARRAPPRAPSAGSSSAGTPSSLLTASLLAASAAAASSATVNAAAAAAAAAGATAAKKPSATAAPSLTSSSVSTSKTAWRISDRIATLRECFRASPPWLGFNIEVKYPTAEEAAALRGVRFLSRNEHCDAVLRVVLEEAKGRKVIFSTFDPDCATLLSLKQPRFPVFFLTNAGTEAFEDPRMSSLAAAVEFAAGSNLQGVVAEASAVLPRLARTVAAAHARGLRLFTWGAANNDPRAYAAQKEAGVDAIISDDVATHARAAGKKSSHTRVEAEAEAAAEARAAEERAKARAEAAAARAARVAAKGGSPPGGISAAFAALATGERPKE